MFRLMDSVKMVSVINLYIFYQQFWDVSHFRINIRRLEHLDEFHFRWLNIKGFDAAFPTSTTLFSTIEIETDLNIQDAG